MKASRSVFIYYLHANGDPVMDIPLQSGVAVCSSVQLAGFYI